MKVFGADGVTVQQFNEGAGGQVVFHLHVHVIPRKDGVPMKPPASEKEKPEVLADHALEARGGAEGAELRSRTASAPSDQRGLAGQHAGEHRAPRDQRTPAKPDASRRRSAPPSGIVASAPGGDEHQLRDARRPASRSRPPAPRPGSREPSSRPRASTRPSQRQTSFGRKPTRISAR